MQTAQSLEGRLANLTRRYVAGVPDRVASIAESLKSCRRESLEAASMLEHEFHTLAGTAGTYGLLGMSAVAAEGEETCAALAGLPIDDESFTYLTFLVDHLRTLAGDRDHHHGFPVIAEGNVVARSGDAVV